jgi:hypothetical protein
VAAVAEVLTMRTGTHQLLLAARLSFAGALSGPEIQAAAARLETDLRAEFPDLDRVFLAPAAVEAGCVTGARRFAPPSA